ncbi:MAG: (2Fe-2S)-binding protein [Phycisphaeraceae bacterium]
MPTRTPPRPDPLHPLRPQVCIHRCICAGIPFTELLALAKANNLTADDLAQQTGASAGCGMCRPYLETALNTGETSFTQLMTTARKTR